MNKGIIIDPKIRFGKPTIAGTRMTVEEVLGALAGGMDFVEIEKEYNLTKKQIVTALQYIAGWIKGEKVIEQYEVPSRR